MKKQTLKWQGNQYYLIGADNDGIKYWLEKASFDCNWYFGFGYVETFTNNRLPHLSKDINSHSHFDNMIFNKNKSCYDAFKECFPINPFNDNEIWKILELMKSFYTIREYSDLLHIHGSHITNNPCNEIIQNDEEYNRINKTVLPSIFEQIYNIMEEK